MSLSTVITGCGSSMQSVGLISIATAVPPHAIEQGDAAAAAHHCFDARNSDFKRLARV
jgi:alkylresorcinol/alkylpyrone synthase